MINHSRVPYFHPGLLSFATSDLIARMIGLMIKKYCRQSKTDWKRLFANPIKFEEKSWKVLKLTWNAKMNGISIFPFSLGFGPSINFLSTWRDLLPFNTTSVIVLTKLGIQAVPFGRTYDKITQILTNYEGDEIDNVYIKRAPENI